ncbi:MAG: hypothetical protein ABI885_12190 [Gammaproteobacteria bacterium]
MSHCRTRPVESPSAEPCTEAASALLGNAIRCTEVPVMRMADALTRISSLLTRLDAEPACGPSGAEDYRQLIERDLSICIQSLQFHDRLIQQLTAVRHLMGAPAMEGELCSGFLTAEGSVELF